MCGLLTVTGSAPLTPELFEGQLYMKNDARAGAFLQGSGSQLAGELTGT